MVTNMKFDNGIITGIMRVTDRYQVTDNMDLSRLVLSRVVLHVQERTRGHSHKGQDEVYIFLFGQGFMVVGNETFSVRTGDIILVPEGEFHQVINGGDTDLVWCSVYNTNNDSTTEYANE